MHRVELKADPSGGRGLKSSTFLMHRVELKVHPSDAKIAASLPVPNAPCGVERSNPLCLVHLGASRS